MNKLYNLASEVSGSGKHVLYWDYDEKSINEDNINLLVSKHKLNLHIIKTLNGFHFIDFHLFTIAQIEKIQKDFYIYFPSTYPTIKQIKKLDDKQGQEFQGQTLRIVKKQDSADLIYIRSYVDKKHIKEISNSVYSERHINLYKLLLKHKLEEYGISKNYNFIICSYLNKK
ncbi:MAG: hypothetical protein HRU03_01515 [Nanoarchaeales archaeon]|nr:hypothetical protein [Nanoarchaeales archaeon]